ncbi:ABC transporter ATP-binding protein [Aureibacillus halotolerans]|uniref:Peptide/nickel transport system ATP-binding protein n=1 Tax=Aureibacillus halotolerans TaxID=1508390 RepID=A0A4R6TQ14_9BACI|nr:dipeptide/oligopeptide/nickel ABC transporter ATP-binding protein [Aureibacillus halotolerans]TDQ34597.1 peptide/nickel transport system ATP-binding protein [Aureibacillus halotolerans]
MSVLDVQGLTKAYKKDKLVLDHISFHLEAGECLGLVGESGCGKSTLARCVLGVETIKDGHIRLFDEPIQHLSEKKLRPLRKHFQAVFQHPTASLNPKRTIRESLLDPYQQFEKELSLAHFSFTSPDAFVRQLLEAVELPEELANRYPHELSGGQKQRVTIARAISIEPAFIVLDEPTASLDVLSQGAVLALLTTLRQSLGIAYLFISHDLAAVHQMSQRIMVMKEGKLVDQFSSDELMANERDSYTKELIAIF